ncbi:NnrS family protein [Candidatus Thiomargarita nelsonii]|uniref:NnrS family protein n=1 Tax=Candidatus Thiomargarita nelsonii TaxID=1003181 RepID=A0A0A6P5Z4_9GAMM|nr:NnrS family protein [Candidatus Thiomargarita nelsonii]
MIINLEPAKNVGKFAFLHLGFRPFFIGASGFAFLSMLIWMALYVFGWQFDFSPFSSISWHAHEMIFGYTIAVIAGFLLTAIKNWTGRQTLHGYPLLFLFLLWLLARILPFFGAWILMAIIDNLFLLSLCISILSPLLKAKHWKSVGLASLVLLLMFSNIVFYLGLFGYLSNGTHYGLYSALYLIIAVIFIMGRRVIPFFIEKGVGYPVELKNWKWVDQSHLIIFLVFAIADMIVPYSYITAGLAGLLFIIHSVILIGWYTPGIWKKPLLWVLYFGYAFIVLGFALKVSVVIAGISNYLVVHAFTFGGIGIMTIGMMARVSLGHTGRNVFEPPKSLFWIFVLIFCGSIVRIFFPLIDISLYIYWIALSQFFWILGFGGFLYVYFPILIYPRIDGHYG